jgi:hypothetical protein
MPKEAIIQSTTPIPISKDPQASRQTEALEKVNLVLVDPKKDLLF